MTFKIWLVMIGTMGLLGLVDGVANQVVGGVNTDVQQGLVAIAGGKVLQIDDAELDSGPLNVDFSFGVVFDRGFWSTLGTMLTWDFSWFQGDLNAVRWLLFGSFTSVTVLLFAMTVGSTLLGAIRSRG